MGWEDKYLNDADADIVFAPPPTKAALAREMKRILALPAGTRLTGPDYDIAESVVRMHPRADEKIGAGICCLVVRKNTYGQGNELHIERNDGTEVDVSYRRALAPRTPAVERADLMAALRQEVAQQTIEYKRDRLTSGAVCAVSAVPLDADTAHVDHIPPWTFAALAEAWLRGSERWPDAWGKWPLLTGIGSRGRCLVNRELAAEWQQFHKWSARLRLIHRDINAVIAQVRAGR
jgi:hypothetical protein